jgi:vancomycin resistance protein YoaR
VGVGSPLYLPRVRRRSRGRSRTVTAAVGAAALLVVALLVGLAYAGSPAELAEGTEVAGIDVGGLTRAQAVALLQDEFAKVSSDPIEFLAGETTFPLAADQLGVEPDWRAAVAAAARTSGGFGPLRGFRRLHTRFFGAEVLPSLAVSNAALEYALDQISERVDREARSAALVRRDMRLVVVPERAGARLEREAAAETLVRALGSIERAEGGVALPVRVTAPPVTAGMLAPAARRARVALSGPVRLRGAARSFRLSPRRIAELLSLPRDGATRLAIAGPRADAYFRALAARIGNPPMDATWEVSGDSVRIVPARAGTELDVPATARALLRAATSRLNRVATVSVVEALPERSTADARAMGIEHAMGAYKTYNSGTWDRITNLRLGVTLLDGTLVPPGGTFSLNGAIGERTVERGFRSAPVIIGTEYAEEVGGGTSQVATTVFNAAWEAGLKITERNPHSLYISRYPLGRDATVYWPSLDLKFQNDTSSWVLVKGFPESDGISVAIYGGERRRVESSSGSMTVTGSAPVKRVKDPMLPMGRTVVEESGSSPSRTSVTRTIYGEDGEVLRTETWTTSYKGETRVVRVGTKPKAPPPATAKPPKGPATPPADEQVTPPPVAPPPAP